MIYASNGGFNWNDIYHMPTQLREFYWNELIAIKEAEKKAYETAKRKSSPSKSITSRR